MREKLYFTISKFSIRSLFYDYFMFFDTTPYLADQLFIRHEVRVWFDSEYAKEGSPYLAIFCHVRKKDVPKFLAALEDLKKSMMLCGHPNYEAEISRFMDNVEKMKGVVLDNTAWTSSIASLVDTAGGRMSSPLPRSSSMWNRSFRRTRSM